MTPTIDMLEKEIEQFHRNIQNSSKLITTLTGAITAIKSQTQIFDGRAAELYKLSQSLPEEIRLEITKQIQELCQRVHDENSIHTAKIQGILENYIATISDAKDEIISIPSAMERVLAATGGQFAEEVATIQKNHAELVADYECKISAYQKQIEQLPETQKTIFTQSAEELIHSIRLYTDAMQQALTTEHQRVRDENSKHVAEIQGTLEKHVMMISDAKDEIISIPSAMERVLAATGGQFAEEVATIQKNHAELVADYECKISAYQKQIEQLPETQKTIFTQSAEELIHSIRLYADTIQQAIVTEHKGYAERLEMYLTQLEEYQNRLAALPSEQKSLIHEKNAELTTMIQTLMDESMREYVALTEKTIRIFEDSTKQYVQATEKSAAVLEEKQTVFLNKLETTNVDQIYHICQEMNSKINMKLNIAIGCGIAATVVALISILVR